MLLVNTMPWVPPLPTTDALQVFVPMTLRAFTEWTHTPIPDVEVPVTVWQVPVLFAKQRMVAAPDEHSSTPVPVLVFVQ